MNEKIKQLKSMFATLQFSEAWKQSEKLRKQLSPVYGSARINQICTSSSKYHHNYNVK